jgi:hypothetical protein
VDFGMQEVVFCELKSATTQMQTEKPKNRIYQKQNYQILEFGKIILYQRNTYVSRSMYTQPSYFFSLTIESEILPLTLFNLQQVFKNNVKIYQTLELRFAGREEDLILYDTIHKTYKVNYWLVQP